MNLVIEPVCCPVHWTRQGCWKRFSHLKWPIRFAVRRRAAALRFSNETTDYWVRARYPILRFDLINTSAPVTPRNSLYPVETLARFSVGKRLSTTVVALSLHFLPIRFQRRLEFKRRNRSLLIKKNNVKWRKSMPSIRHRKWSFVGLSLLACLIS